MVLVLDGDFMYPIREYYENIPFDIDGNEVSIDLKNELRKWLSNYSKFTVMTIEELSNHSETIDSLDKQGIELLKQFHVELSKNNELDKLYYFSLCKDKFLFAINKDGRNRVFDNEEE